MDKKRGQIWVETIIYTLIAFVMIGLVLFFATPKISQVQDKSIIEQSISVMENIDLVILDIRSEAGSTREVKLKIRKGDLKIDSAKDMLVFEMISRHAYSEPGEDISEGNIIIHTAKKGDLNIVNLTLDYSELYNITYNRRDNLKTISSSSTPYKLFITNRGGSPVVIDFGFDTIAQLDTIAQGEDVPCGDGICEEGENEYSCPQDCMPGCGNGVCDQGETPDNCQADCSTEFCNNGQIDGKEQCDGGVGCQENCICGPGYAPKYPAEVGCKLETALLEGGTVSSIWPTSAPRYFDSPELPIDGTQTQYILKYINFNNGAELRCMRIQNVHYIYLEGPPEYSRSHIILQVPGYMVPGDTFNIWNSQCCGDPVRYCS